MSDGNKTAESHDGGAKLTSGDLADATDPFPLFAEWLAEATASEPNDPTAMALATVDEAGLPDVRMVLLKGFDAGGLRLLHEPGEPQGPRARGASEGGALLPLEVAAPAGAGPRRRRAGRRRRRPTPISPRARGWPDRRLGEQAVGAAREPLRAGEGGGAATRRASRVGEVPRPPHWSGFRHRAGTRSSSGATAPSACMIACASAARQAAAGRRRCSFPERCRNVQNGALRRAWRMRRMTDRFAAKRERMVERQLVARGIDDERVLAAIRQRAARGLRPGRPCRIRLRRQPAADRRGPDDLAALHRRADGGGGADRARRARARGRRRLRLRRGDPCRARAGGRHDRAACIARRRARGRRSQRLGYSQCRR